MKPVAYLTAERLRCLVEDMGLNPGWHASALMYGHYTMMCKEDGLTPLSTKGFGSALRRLGYVPRVLRVGGKPTRGWQLTGRAARGLPPRTVSS